MSVFISLLLGGCGVCLTINPARKPWRRPSLTDLYRVFWSEGEFTKVVQGFILVENVCTTVLNIKLVTRNAHKMEPFKFFRDPNQQVNMFYYDKSTPLHYVHVK